MLLLFMKKLFIRFTVCVFRERLNQSVCVFLSILVLRVGCGESINRVNGNSQNSAILYCHNMPLLINYQ